MIQNRFYVHTVLSFMSLHSCVTHYWGCSQVRKLPTELWWGMENAMGSFPSKMDLHFKSFSNKRSPFSTVLFTLSTSEWTCVLGCLVFPGRPLHHCDIWWFASPRSSQPCVCILYRIPEWSHSYSTNWTGTGTRGDGARHFQGGRKLCSMLVGCAPCQPHAQPGLGWSCCCACRLGLRQQTEPDNHCHRLTVAIWLTAWLSFCLAVCPALLSIWRRW